MGASEYLHRWPLLALYLADRSARGLQARAGTPCSWPAPAVVLQAVDAAPFYLSNFLGRRGPAPLLLIAQPATCARPASLPARPRPPRCRSDWRGRISRPLAAARPGSGRPLRERPAGLRPGRAPAGARGSALQLASARRGAAGRRCRPVLPVEFSRPPWTGAASADRAAGDVRQARVAGPPAG
ncbi:hypothetical protein JAB4_059450 (plasmid) [Janthinobacterium sp. HH102]|nr:hypothetical protein JAB4_059450 [Janthinobacterium sp. HH102]